MNAHENLEWIMTIRNSSHLKVEKREKKKRGRIARDFEDKVS